jgi:phospholipase/carboxylesterase
MSAALSFVHKFEPGSGTPPMAVLLLHGTGGDEEDLLPFGRAIAPGAALLAPRGKVIENGMARFFRRLGEGVFDEDDVRRRARELGNFVIEARRAYQLPAPVAVGFSNGANIAGALLFLHPQALRGAVLIRAMVPLRDPPKADLSEKPVLILSGGADRIVPSENPVRLAALLAKDGAAVRHEILPASHALTQQDMRLSAAFIDALRGNSEA